MSASKGSRSRISLRIPRVLKTQLEEAAKAQRLDLNSYIVMCVEKRIASISPPGQNAG